MDNKITIMEVGARDGLQNVKEALSVESRIALIEYLSCAGLTQIEAGAFVHPKRVPAMAGSDEIARHFEAKKEHHWYLAPNLRGLQDALDLGVKKVAFFTASSDTFNQNNIGMSVQESLKNLETCFNSLIDNGYRLHSDMNAEFESDQDLKVRVYISTVIGCPYDGRITPSKTLQILDKLPIDKIAQFSLGDTIGVGVPSQWRDLLKQVDPNLIKKDKIALHCHDTYNTALLCVHEGLNMGIKTFDSSIGGLGGCPYAPGASGNLATEDLLYYLSKEGLISEGLLDNLLDTFSPERTQNLINRSKVYTALTAKSSCN